MDLLVNCSGLITMSGAGETKFNKNYVYWRTRKGSLRKLILLGAYVKTL